MAQKLFRDPLYDYIAIDKDSWLLKLVNCPEVQRLRYINQLGLSHFAYPGSTHSRFSHSLGVLHLVQQGIAHLKREYPRQFKQQDEETLLAAALLHDIGHAPLSHGTESIFGDHSERALDIIVNSDSGVYKVLSKRNYNLPSKVSSLIAEKGDAPLWQRALISSPLDMDRLDYLRRDSLHSGAEYGNFDYFRIIHTMQLEKKVIKGRQKELFIVWPDKTKYAIEEYIFSRFYMYQSVYFHHTTRGFEKLLQTILKRAQNIAKDNKNFRKELLPPMKLLLGGRESRDLRKFQDLTDHVLLAQVTIWQSGKDKILSDLSKRLLLRKGIGWTQAVAKTGFEMTDKIEKVRSYLQKKGKDHRYYFIEDSTGIPPYKPYSSTSEEQTSVNSIMLFDPRWSKTGFMEITGVPGLERLRAITGAPSSILRYYFPKEHERQIKKLLS